MSTTATPAFTVSLEPPRQPAVEAMLGAGAAFAQSLYPPESNFLLDVSELEAPGVRFYVARDAAGEAIGTAALVADAARPARAELKRMYVEPSARRLGVARGLLEHLEADAAAHGIHEIVLETGDLHTAAQALYERAGYRPIPQFGQYVGEAHSVCFAKAVSPER
ncbi:GNAT family N-acetyltransferase [Agromyces archimandritae]|uniref:GNAT family N-acetyltransferase n=1 Tax=Agromyces archimandritae TaxID=2781962 RepID=A0A975IPX2_9MICO|nr:GNAT family N-acetyltransferase [Agromyces archimandritae]QTX05749.1 GNAT family N-acetyltransferase [Agromyces archimandritae]